MNYLDFESKIKEVEDKITSLSHIFEDEKTDKELQRLNKKRLEFMESTYSKLTDWQVVQLSRHPDRPYFKDLLPLVFTDFQELHGDRAFGDDLAVIGGLAKLNNQPVMVIGQEKGRDTKSKIKHNFGMMHPEGYRKALRLMKLAEKFNMPVVTFIDTPGAYPGIKAEERGQSEAIARNLFEMSALKVPVVCTVIGEGCSGGALGIGVGDKLLMLQYSYFATISPEGCASILHKTAEKASEVTQMMNITSNRLKELKIVDGVVPEPLGGAHRDYGVTAENIKKALSAEIKELSKMSVEQRNSKRYDKLMSFGQFKEA
ncbi:acetyl-CoA carboxylase carboxyltransferase subunit alpha [Francisella adeliensis]|uniref:Acetyl-coenzyme A carboxylase carboxyl transferase subunit alpha n=1 Tax=Francisella adeliensis TaxID=2007306 RepID=A0A2Z4XXF7_9GAMM|nr:acetyl-CoA carboxylase carboxyltransferase subunit alpha [Francisella adeliensis]AXA33571.1 acetyl-CoA carboxylase carboxyl transferase subunit alpha [Francisella adeliensis]MBK2084722.1 acetyl-CoA carboxylase carboxyltransferase subunit alpha [Francisella adeliensis]MBK2097335.1 acetyl-CoA carboxylase carboxyltransferase subunit alpha [Francisella adeliensis]QIW11803.1 acetyl-CoA carboxylase carboxyltransferase subunit alpha [Francisella adeliensis]QIW13679.1 acetyl-CoA carboxylase carboxy